MSLFRLATSELLSTFFPTWIWQGREWRKGKVPRYDPYYWGSAHSHPVLSTYYPPHAILSALCVNLRLDTAYRLFLGNLIIHMALCFAAWTYVLTGSPLVRVFGALTITFGAYALKQQPCIIYTLAWFPLSLYQDPIISSVSVGMMLLAGYYPFTLHLLPVAVLSHLLWYKEIWLVTGCVIGLIQLLPFLKYLPKTVKRLTDSCESPEVERRFYVGVIPLILIPFSTSQVWPLTLASAIFALGFMKQCFPRVHERWLIVLQFCIGWMATSALNNLNLTSIQLGILLAIHAFDLFWHNRECLPPRPYCELWQRPSRVFNSKLTRFLETNLGDYKVSGLPFPLFTGHINRLKTIGYCGSMQTRDMWSWRKSFNHDPFIDGVDEGELTKHSVKYSFSRKKLGWNKTEIKNLYQNPTYDQRKLS